MHKKALRDRAELTKEERNKERSVKKRKIKAMQKGKLVNKKEALRAQGLQLAERFAVKETKRAMEKQQKKKGKKEEGSSTLFLSITNGTPTSIFHLQKPQQITRTNLHEQPRLGI